MDFLASTARGLLLVGVAMCCCSRQTSGEVKLEPTSETSSVGFDLQPLPATAGKHLWLATHSSSGSIARFKIELTDSDSVAARNEFNFKFGEGKFLAETGSDPSALLIDLKRALQATNLPSGVTRIETLPFRYVSFGEKQSRIDGEGFVGNPPGDWTAMKLFIGEEQQLEVFLNLNGRLKKGEFSLKDGTYGDDLLAELAKVL